MTELKHTPAPWRVDIAHLNGKEWHKGRLQEAVWSEDNCIAICSDNRENAHLIATAPELLEALEEMVMIAKIAGFEKKAWAEIQVAEKAIAKAKGIEG